MGEPRKSDDFIIFILKVVVISALSAAFFLTVYRYDNKYFYPGPQGKDGVLILDETIYSEHPILFLVDGWEYYSGRLLTPEDFIGTNPTPNQYIFIGQLGGFEMFNNGTPHGCASYRLIIRIPEQTNTYLLELPEIFSAYRLYINGKQVAQMGEPNQSNYKPETRNRTISIEAHDKIEILFAVSDYSHFYSGMVYPPAFGEPEVLLNLLNTRLVLRSLVCAVALTIGLISVMVGFLGRNHVLTILFGLICLFFVGYISYPITRTLITKFNLPYVIENFSFCAMLCIAMLISIKIINFPKKWWIPFICFGCFMCIFTVLLFQFIPLGKLNIMLVYSNLVSVYEWASASLILITVCYAIGKNIAYNSSLLYGAIIFACALIADRLLPLYDPILFGWFIEIASFALVLCIGVVIAQEVATRYKDSIVAVERAHSMERLYNSQLMHYHTIKKEIEQAKTYRHDLRHHLTVMNQYIHNHNYDKLETYIKEYCDTTWIGELPEYCPIDVINVLTHHYHTIAEQNSIQLEIRCDFKTTEDPTHTNMSHADLCCLYANLLENAVEACLRISTGKRYIRIAVFRNQVNYLNIRVWNSANNVMIGSNHFISTKQNNKKDHSGLGLTSVSAIAKKYMGKAEFNWNEKTNCFESKIEVKA